MAKIDLAHASDLHLDLNREQSQKCFDFSISAAIDRECGLFIIPGDIWQQAVPFSDKSPVNYMRDAVQRLAEHMPVVILKGNHDPDGSIVGLRENGCRHRVYCIETPQQVMVAPHVVVSAIPYVYKAHLLGKVDVGQDESDRMAEEGIRQMLIGFRAGVGPDDAHIVGYHGNMKGAEMESGQRPTMGDIYMNAFEFETLSGADYGALGHLHKTQRVGNRCAYSGSQFHNNFGETSVKNMLIVSVATGTEPVIEKVPLPSRGKLTIDITMADEWSIDDLADAAAVEYADDVDIKVRYHITKERSETFDRAALSEALARRGFDVDALVLDPMVIARERVRCAEIAEFTSLRDKVKAWTESVKLEVTESVLAKADALEMAV